MTQWSNQKQWIWLNKKFLCLKFVIIYWPCIVKRFIILWWFVLCVVNCFFEGPCISVHVTFCFSKRLVELGITAGATKFEAPPADNSGTAGFPPAKAAATSLCFLCNAVYSGFDSKKSGTTKTTGGKSSFPDGWRNKNSNGRNMRIRLLMPRETQLW